MLNISEMLTDPDFVSGFVLKRPGGEWAGEGVWTETHTFIERVGCIQPAGVDDVQFLPEGERNARAIRIWAEHEIRATETPDLVLWNGGVYRVVASRPFAPWGYYYVVATEVTHGN